MLDYLKGFIFFISLIIFLYLFGSSLVKNSDNFSYRLVIGYIVYSFIIAIIGIPISVFHLSWKLFMILVIIVDVLLIILIIVRLILCKIKIIPDGMFRDNWCTLCTVGLIMFTSLAYVESYWVGNCLDDGFYINKMATLPYVTNPFSVTPATGLLNNSFNTYLLNTGEMEASVYIYLLNIGVGVYARFFLAAFNYFLLANVIYAFVYKLYEKKQWKFDKSILQYIVIIIILFGFEYHYLVDNNILEVTDSWQFTTAMYYGSSIVKTMGILLLVLPVIINDKIGIKNVVLFIMISIVLISKSTIAVPLIFLVAIGNIFIYLVFNKSMKFKISSIFLILLIIIVSLLLKNNVETQTKLYSLILTNLHSKIFIISLLAFISGFFLKSKEIIKTNIIILIITCLIVINPLNNIFETLSVYTFVSQRMLTLLTYTIIILGFTYLNIYVFLLVKNKYFITCISLVFMIILFAFSIISYNKQYGSIINGYKIIVKNKYLIPNSTIELGKKLQNLYIKEKKNINVLVSEGNVNVDGYQHSLAVILRSYAPNTRIITSIGRYGVTTGNAFSNYSQSDTNIYYSFIVDPNMDTYNKFKKLLEKYPINCVVFSEDNKTDYMKKLDYELYDEVLDKNNAVKYFIYYNKNVRTELDIPANYSNNSY